MNSSTTASRRQETTLCRTFASAHYLFYAPRPPHNSSLPAADSRPDRLGPGACESYLLACGTPSRIRRTLSTLLLSAALWSLPCSVRGQLYVAQLGTNIVGEYDATTGAAINSSFITGLSDPEGLLLSGTALFMTSAGNYTVGKYDATSGMATNANLITTGLLAPNSLALSGNNLFVASGGNIHYPVSEYNATTGAAINANFVTGLVGPNRLAISGSILFVADATNDTVGEYNVTTGAAINANFITSGLLSPVDVAIAGNNLFVANFGNNTVSEYNATTGAAINANFVTGLTGPEGLVVSGNELYVTNIGNGGLGTGSVGEYDATTGAAINSSFITGLTDPISLAIIPETSTAVLLALGAVALLRSRRRVSARNSGLIALLGVLLISSADSQIYFRNADGGTVNLLRPSTYSNAEEDVPLGRGAKVEDRDDVQMMPRGLARASRRWRVR